MKKYILLLLLAFGMAGVSSAQIFDGAIVTTTTLPAGVSIIGAGGNDVTGWGGAGGDGVNISENSALIYTHPSALALGDYIVTYTVANQNQYSYFDIQGWVSTGAPDYTTTNKEAQANWYTVSKTINVTDPSFVFGLVRGVHETPGGHASNRVIIQHLTIEYDGPSSEADIVGFSFPEEIAPAVIDAAAGTVAVTVPYNTDRTNLTPSFFLSAAASLSSGSPASGVSGNFSSPVNYVVEAEDGTTKNWTVTVTEAPARTDKDILAFSVPEQTGTAVIDAAAGTITLEVDQLTDMSAITAFFSLSPGATINLAQGVAQDYDTSNSNTYTVTAEDGSTKNYTVTVNQVNIVTTPCSVKVP